MSEFPFGFRPPGDDDSGGAGGGGGLPFGFGPGSDPAQLGEMLQQLGAGAVLR